MRILLIIVFCTLLSGCVSTSGQIKVGSSAWHEERIDEIEQAYKSGEITKAEYIKLKNEADQTRADYKSRVVAGYLAGNPLVGKK